MSEDRREHGDDLIGWLLGALSPEEADRFAAHLPGCASCQAELARLTETADQLVEAVPPVAPPAELREQLLNAVREETTRPQAASADPPTASPDRKRLRWPVRIGSILAILGAAVAAVVILTSGSATHSNTPQTVPGTVASAGGAHARALVQISQHNAVLVLSRLAPPPRGHVYQAWVIPRGSSAVPTGALFSIPPSGDTRILLPALRGVTRVIVSAEPPRGSRTPTPPPIVVVDLAHPPGSRKRS